MAVARGGLVLNREKPVGVIDSVNTVFTTTKPFITGTLMVYRNGIALSPIDDFTEDSATQFTLVEAPEDDGSYADKLLVTYQIA